MDTDALDDFHLDIYGQTPRINKLYTQITFCFQLPEDSDSKVVNILTKGIEKLSNNFPWIAGQVVNENGSFKIKPFDKSHLVIKDYRKDDSIPTWDDFRRANFPFKMLDERIFAPCATFITSDDLGLPVFLVQTNFVTGGLLLTINGQHGSMDMTGQGQVMYLLGKACRNEPFTVSELEIGNMNRTNLIDLLDDTPGPDLDHQVFKNTIEGEYPVLPKSAAVITWAYYSFSSTALATLKSIAMQTTPPGSFVSTDDVLSAFVWQSLTRVRRQHFGIPSNLNSTLSRNVDARRYLSIPSTYPGFITSSTLHISAIDSLVLESLGTISSQLRAALDPASIRHRMRATATVLSNHGKAQKAPFAITSVPELDVRLSSWAKENCYDIDFGFGKPEAVRRPRFTSGAREGLVYFLPKTLDAEIMVGLCLKKDDLKKLSEDEEFARFGTYVG